MVGTTEDLKLLGAAILFAVALLLPNWRRIRRLYRRRARATSGAWRDLREALAGAKPGALIACVRVIDGDTVDDVATGIRYRLANIDCPETDDRAGCYRERIRGEQAKGAAQMILSAAARIEVRPTGRIDRYGRTVAYLRVDDRDYGELMIERGFARRWSGRRESWCGASGGLVILAQACSMEWRCKTRGACYTPEVLSQSSVVTLPVIYRRKD